MVSVEDDGEVQVLAVPPHTLVNSNMSRAGGVGAVVFGVVGVMAFALGMAAFPPFATIFAGGAMILSLVILAGFWGMAGRFREEITFDVRHGVVEFATSEFRPSWETPLSEVEALRTRAYTQVQQSGGSGTIDTVSSGTSAQTRRRTFYSLSLAMKDGGELWVSTFGTPQSCRREVEAIAGLTGLAVDDRTQQLGVARESATSRDAEHAEPGHAAAAEPVGVDCRLTLPPSKPRPLRNAITLVSSLIFLLFPAYVLFSFARGSEASLGGFACMLCPLSIALLVWSGVFLKVAQGLPKRGSVELDTDGLSVRVRAPFMPVEWHRHCDTKSIRRVELDRGMDGVFYLALVLARDRTKPRTLLRAVWDWVMTASPSPAGPGFFDKKSEWIVVWSVDYRNQTSGPTIEDLLSMRQRIRAHLASLRE